jgi:hypothetical protein
VSITTEVSPFLIHIEARVLLSRGSGDVQTGQVQFVDGTPYDVPEPSTVISIEMMIQVIDTNFYSFLPLLSD